MMNPQSPGMRLGDKDPRVELCRQLSLGGPAEVHELIVAGVHKPAELLLKRGLNAKTLAKLGYDAAGLTRLGFGEAALRTLGLAPGTASGSPASRRTSAGAPSSEPSSALRHPRGRPTTWS